MPHNSKKKLRQIRSSFAVKNTQSPHYYQQDTALAWLTTFKIQLRMCSSEWIYIFAGKLVSTDQLITMTQSASSAQSIAAGFKDPIHQPFIQEMRNEIGNPTAVAHLPASVHLLGYQNCFVQPSFHAWPLHASCWEGQTIHGPECTVLKANYALQ